MRLRFDMRRLLDEHEAKTGIGPYSFSPWKVAISGLYKSLNFVILGPQDGKPVMVDDTCYFLPYDTEEKAKIVLELLKTEQASSFLSSIIFWDSKRPISVDVLQRLKLNHCKKK